MTAINNKNLLVLLMGVCTKSWKINWLHKGKTIVFFSSGTSILSHKTTLTKRGEGRSLRLAARWGYNQENINKYPKCPFNKTRLWFNNFAYLFDGISVSWVQEAFISSERLTPRRPHRIVTRTIEHSILRWHFVLRASEPFQLGTFRSIFAFT